MRGLLARIIARRVGKREGGVGVSKGGIPCLPSRRECNTVVQLYVIMRLGCGTRRGPI